MRSELSASIMGLWIPLTIMQVRFKDEILKGDSNWHSGMDWTIKYCFYRVRSKRATAETSLTSTCLQSFRLPIVPRPSFLDSAEPWHHFQSSLAYLLMSHSGGNRLDVFDASAALSAVLRSLFWSGLIDKIQVRWCICEVKAEARWINDETPEGKDGIWSLWLRGPETKQVWSRQANVRASSREWCQSKLGPWSTQRTHIHKVDMKNLLYLRKRKRLPSLILLFQNLVCFQNVASSSSNRCSAAHW